MKHWLFCVLSVFALGCSVNVDKAEKGGAGGAPATSGVETGSTKDALDTTWISGPYDVGPNSYINLQPASTHFCILTKSQGIHTNVNSIDATSVHLSSDGSWWTLRSDSENYAQAYCFKLSGFVGPGSNVKWISGNFIVDHSTCSGTSSTDMWWGDAASVLNGVWGGLTVSGGTVHADWSGDAWLPSTLRASGCNSGSNVLRGWGNSLFVGEPHSGQLAKFYNTGYVVTNWGTTQTAYMDLAPTDTTMCFLTRLSGEFYDLEDYAWIYPNGSYWRLRVWGKLVGSGYRNIAAGSTCYLRDQR